MVLTGDRQRFLSGMWVLAAIFVLSIALLALSRMYAEKLAETVPELKETRELERKIDAAAGADTSRTADATAMARLYPFAGGNFLFDATRGSEEKQAEAGQDLALPKLTGIMMTSNSAGRSSWLAILDGHAVGEGKQAGGFVVQLVRSDGVSLQRDGKSWFVKAQNPAAHSVTLAMDRTATPPAAVEEKKIAATADKPAKPETPLPSLPALLEKAAKAGAG